MLVIFGSCGDFFGIIDPEPFHSLNSGLFRDALQVLDLVGAQIGSHSNIISI